MWMRAIAESVNDFAKDQQKANTEMLNSMSNKIEAVKPYTSPMDSMPKPSFF